MNRRMSFMYFRSIPKDVKDQFKETCYKRGRTMTQVVVQLMKDYIREGRSYGPAKHLRKP